MKKALLILAGAVLAGSPALADELSVVGSWSSLPLDKQYEAPFWQKTLPAAADGELTVKFTTHDQMGLGVGDVFRLLGKGVFDVGMTVADYAVADAPELEGIDVPLVAMDAAKEHAAMDAARPMVEDIFNKRFNSHVLAIAPYPPQVVFCNKPVKSLGDLKGLKIRASGRMTAKFMEALGAEGVNVAFSEVPGALEKGVVDCAVTGAGSGYSAGWWEVSKYLFAIPLGGWDPVVTAINLDKWNSLDSETQGPDHAGDQDEVRGARMGQRAGLPDQRRRVPDRQGRVQVGQGPFDDARRADEGGPGARQGDPRDEGAARVGGPGRRGLGEALERQRRQGRGRQRPRQEIRQDTARLQGVNGGVLWRKTFWRPCAG